MSVLDYSVERQGSPSFSAVNVEDAKQHLRIFHDAEDDLIRKLIDAAVLQVQNDARIQLAEQTLVMKLDEFPGRCSSSSPDWGIHSGRSYARQFDVIELRFPPLLEATKVEYLDTGSVLQLWPTSEYTVDLPRYSIFLAKGKSWPDTSDERNAITITYKAGSQTVEAVNAVAIAAVKLWLAHLYENREIVTTGTVNEIPLGYSTLINSLRPGGYP